MALRTPNDRPDPDLLRRLKEFQVQVRQPTRKAQPIVSTRGPLSAQEADVLVRLRHLRPSLADSLEQALADVNDVNRLSYMGPAGEIREVMRTAIAELAPDEEVRKQPWFKGIQQGKKVNPSQSERARYAAQKYGRDTDLAQRTDDVIEELIGKVARATYKKGSGALHAGTGQAEVRRLTGWVFTVLNEVLPDS
jgi:hypothetical protein